MKETRQSFGWKKASNEDMAPAEENAVPNTDGKPSEQV